MELIGFALDSQPVAQGAARMNSALDSVGKHIDAMLQKAQKIQQQLANALNVNSGGSGIGAGFNRTQTQFQQHQSKLQQIAARGMQAIQQEEVRGYNQLNAIRERAAQQELARQRRLEQQARSRPGGFAGFARRSGSTIREAGESLQEAGAVFTLGSAGLVKLAQTAIEAAGQVEAVRRGLQTLDKTGAETSFARLKKQADDLKVGFNDYATSVIRVRSTQKLTADESEKLVQGLVNVSRQVGASREQQDRTITALNQILSKGKITAEELRGQLLEAIPNLAPIIEKRFGTLQAEELEKKFGTKKFVSGLIEELAKIERLKPTALEQFQNQLSNLALKLAPIGVKVLELLIKTLESVLPIVDRLVERFTSLPESTQKIIIAIGALVTAMAPLLLVLGSVIQSFGALLNLFGVVAGGGAAAGAATSIGSIGLALGGVTVAVGLFAAAYATDFAGIRAITADAAKFIVQQFDYVKKSVKEISPSLGELKSTFRSFSDSTKPIVQDFWQHFKNVAEVSIAGTVEVAKQGVNLIKSIFSDSFTGFVLSGGTNRALKEIADSFSGEAGNKALGIIATAGTGPAFDAIAGQLREINAPDAPKLKIPGGNPAELVRQAEAQQKAFLDAKKLKDELSKLNKPSGTKGAKELSEIEQLSKQLKEAEKDLSSFQKTNSKEFGLRLQLEDARRFKSELEEIVTLRRDLGEPLKAALPGTGTAARAEIERLKALKELREFEKTVDVRTPFIQAQEASIEATKKQIEGLDKFINDSLPKTEEATIEAALAQNELYKALLATNPALAEQYLLQAKNADETIRAAKATELFKSLQDELNGRLKGVGNLSASQATALKLQSDAYKNLTQEQRDQLTVLAQQVDEQELYQAQLEESRRIAEQFGQTVTGLFETLFERGPRAFFDELLGTLKRTLSRMAAEILSSQVMKLLGFGGGNAQSSFGSGGGSARSTSPLAGLGNLITGGGGASGGGGSFLTPGFAGGPGAGGILNGGGSSSGGGGILGSLFGGGNGGGGILSKIPGLGKLFGASGGSSGSLQPIIQGGVANGQIAGAGATSGLGASLGGLAAGGAIAGGGLLGSLAGGKSPIGRLLGGVGGSLLGGFGAALLNPALLPVLFSNPITAIIGGALIGGALLFNFLGGREQRKFRKTVEDEYQIKVDGKQQGTELYKSIKALGEEQFGKGKFGKKMLETIRLQKAQEQLAAYAEASGQENNALVKKFRDQKELTSQFDPRNQFVKRYAGGSVNAFQSYIVGEHRPEVFTPSTSGQIYPSFPDFAKASAQSNGGEAGGAWTHELKAFFQRTNETNARVAAALNRFESMSPEDVLVAGARRNPDAITGAVATSFDRRTAASDTVRDRVNQR